MSQLRIAEFKDGSIIKASTKNPLWGTAMVIGESVTFNNGIMNVSKRIGFLRAPIAQLEALGLARDLDLNAKLTALGADTVKIVRQESITPFFEGQSPKINPTSQEVIKDHAGNPIFMQDVLVNTGSGESDSLVSRTAPAVAVAEAGDDA